MVMLTAANIQQLREALQIGVVKCSERCLYQSAKWIAELLDSLPEPDDIPGLKSQEHLARSIPSLFTIDVDPDEAALEAKELNKYLLAKAFFDCKEFDRCAAVFLPEAALSGILAPKSENIQASPKGKGKGKATVATTANASQELPRISQKSLFLALYAKFMSGEKAKDEETEMIMGPHDVGAVMNKQLVFVSRYLEMWFAQHRNDDGEVPGSQGFLEYLYGVVLAKAKSDDAALHQLMASIHVFPWNWGCWLEITNLVSRTEELTRVSQHLPQNIMSYMFHLNAAINLYQQGQNLSSQLAELLEIFPTSSFLLTCKALLAYHSKDLIAAEQDFSQLLALHPYRLDSLDHYSNILYVLNQRPKLAFLAHLCSNIDKFRPESCVVIGNYYSLLSLHEKAVQYFRRALTLDRTCLSAWTLMGHEYVELKNTHAAIESYRRAVDVNRRDYRAWYGLGQAYEMLEMHAYSLWYYKMASGLRPWDGKMWQAVGSCLQKMGRHRDGIKALKRALLADSYYDSTSSSFGSGASADRMTQMEPEILLQIASMYDALDEEDEAKAYMELCIAQEDGGGGGGGGAGLGDSVSIHRDEPGSDDEGGGSRSGGGDGGPHEGTGVTVSTSKARMWLARYALNHEEYALAHRLATELTQDGFEVEEAKALVRDARSRMELADAMDR